MRTISIFETEESSTVLLEYVELLVEYNIIFEDDVELIMELIENYRDEECGNEPDDDAAPSVYPEEEDESGSPAETDGESETEQ